MQCPEPGSSFCLKWTLGALDAIESHVLSRRLCRNPPQESVSGSPSLG